MRLRLIIIKRRLNSPLTSTPATQQNKSPNSHYNRVNAAQVAKVSPDGCCDRVTSVRVHWTGHGWAFRYFTEMDGKVRDPRQWINYYYYYYSVAATEKSPPTQLLLLPPFPRTDR